MTMSVAKNRAFLNNKWITYELWRKRGGRGSDPSPILSVLKNGQKERNADHNFYRAHLFFFTN